MQFLSSLLVSSFTYHSVSARPPHLVMEWGLLEIMARPAVGRSQGRKELLGHVRSSEHQDDLGCIRGLVTGELLQSQD